MSSHTFEKPQSVGGTPRASLPLTGTPRARNSKFRSLQAQQLQIAHQQVNLDVDLCNKKVVGYTELSVVPTSSSLREIRLDARAMIIKRIFVNNSELTDYAYNDHLYINNPKTFDLLENLHLPNLWDEFSPDFNIHQHHLLRQKLSYIFGHVDEDQMSTAESPDNLNTEELIIYLPEELRLEITNINSIYTPGSGIQTSNLTPLRSRLKAAANDIYNPIQIGIEFEIVNPKNGLHFVCDQNLDHSFWHAYTVNSSFNVSASSWVPCIDNLLSKSTWSFELSIPRSVRDLERSSMARNIAQSEQEGQDIHTTEGEYTSRSLPPREEDIAIDEDEDDRENIDLTVCSGDYVNTKESPHPTDKSKKVVSWSLFNPVCAHHVGWAVGAFQSLELTNFDDVYAAGLESDEEFEGLDKDESGSSIILYYLPGQGDLARNTCIFAQKALDFFSKEYGSFPFSSYGIAFVQDTIYPRNNFAGLSLLDVDMLYPSNIIEPMFRITEDILECIAGQWSGVSIVPMTLNDYWCTIGIAKFMSLQFIRTLMGLNEYRFQIKTKMDLIVEKDIGQRPLGIQSIVAPVSETDLTFIRLKAPAVMFILDRRMTKTDKSFGFSRVLPKLFLQALSGDLPNGALSTAHFQYVCEKVNRNRLEAFFKQWVYGVGTPIFNISQKFNKKRSLIEVIIRQSQLQQAKPPHPKAETFITDSLTILNSEQTFPVQQTFLGPMTIRVHEADGTPYEHIVDIKDKVVKFDVQYNTRFKRSKKAKDENGEELQVFSKLGDILESEQERRSWNFEEWPKRDEEFSEPFEWLRVDTDFEWIGTFNINQPDYMYGSQLQQDRDIEAQIAACEYFGSQEKPNRVYCTMLTRTLMDKRYFYGVRISAALSLAKFSTVASKFVGLDYLIKSFRQLYCFEKSIIPKNNDFSDFAEFFVKSAIPAIMAGVKDENGSTPAIIKSILLNLLKYNDNSNNDFDDCYYLSSLVRALARSVVPFNGDHSIILNRNEFEFIDEKEQKFLKKAIEEIGRLQKLDRWVPSYQSMISRACIEQRIELARNHLSSFSFEQLLHHTHPKFPPAIRLLAFRGLFLLGGLKNGEILNYFLKVCLLDMSSAKFRIGLIQVLIDCISEAAIHGIPSTLDDAEFKLMNSSSEETSRHAVGGNLVVVEESQSAEMNQRRDAFARATVKGAIDLLRRDLAKGLGLQHTIWELLHTSLLSLQERKIIFILSDILYNEEDIYPVTIPVPCVPIEEFKKKVVAKHSEANKIVIKREGRFKISLSTKHVSSEPKLKGKEAEANSTPVSNSTGYSEVPARQGSRLTLKIPQPQTTLSHSEERPPLPQRNHRLVTRDPKNKMILQVRFRNHKLKPLETVPLLSNVTISGGTVLTISFKKQTSIQRLQDWNNPKEMPRYVRFHLFTGKVEISPTSFEERNELSDGNSRHNTELDIEGPDGDPILKSNDYQYTEDIQDNAGKVESGVITEAFRSIEHNPESQIVKPKRNLSPDSGSSLSSKGEAKVQAENEEPATKPVQSAPGPMRKKAEKPASNDRPKLKLRLNMR